MAAGGIAAGPAQIHLCLVGGVLRHQQDLTAAVSQRPELLLKGQGTEVGVKSGDLFHLTW